LQSNVENAPANRQYYRRKEVTDGLDRDALPARNAYERVHMIFICRSYVGTESFCGVLRDSQKGDVEWVIGTSRAIHEDLAEQWCNSFWDKWSQPGARWADALATAKTAFWDYWVDERDEHGGTLPFEDQTKFNQSERLDWSTPDKEDRPGYQTAEFVFKYNDALY